MPGLIAQMEHNLAPNYAVISLHLTDAVFCSTREVGGGEWMWICDIFGSSNSRQLGDILLYDCVAAKK